MLLFCLRNLFSGYLRIGVLNRGQICFWGTLGSIWRLTITMNEVLSVEARDAAEDVTDLQRKVITRANSAAKKYCSRYFNMSPYHSPIVYQFPLAL